MDLPDPDLKYLGLLCRRDIREREKDIRKAKPGDTLAEYVDGKVRSILYSNQVIISLGGQPAVRKLGEGEPSREWEVVREPVTDRALFERRVHT